MGLNQKKSINITTLSPTIITALSLSINVTNLRGAHILPPTTSDTRLGANPGEQRHLSATACILPKCRKRVEWREKQRASRALPHVAGLERLL